MHFPVVATAQFVYGILKKIKTIFKGYKEHVNAIKFKGPNIFVSGSDDKTIRIWRIYTPSLIREISADSLIKFISFEYKTQLLVVVYEDGCIQNINPNKRYPLKKTYFKTGVICSILAEELQILVTGHKNGLVQFIYSKTLRLLKSSKLHSDKVNLIDFCGNAQIIATCSDDFQ